MRRTIVILTVVAIGFLAIAFPLFIAPQFKLMFSDFGAVPKLTKFALKRWFGPALASPSLMLLGAASLEPPASSKARNYTAFAFLLAAAGVVLAIAALYLPLFELNDEVRPA